MEFLLASAAALWFGILISISPCPLAVNIAALSFISRNITRPGMVFVSGAAYTLGRMAAYALLGAVIISSLLSLPQAARFLQKYADTALGPVLLLSGAFLLGIIKIPFPAFSLSDRQSKRLAGSGALGAFALGLVFTLAFCPVSAALFFGSLMPLALKSRAGIILPFIFGIGSGLPVLVPAVMLAAGVSSLNRWFNGLSRIEIYSRTATGVIFICAGLYYSFRSVVSFLG